MKIEQEIIKTVDPENNKRVLLFMNRGYRISHVSSLGDSVVVVLEKEIWDDSPETEGERVMREALSNIDMIVCGTGSPLDMCQRIKTVLKGVQEELNR